MNGTLYQLYDENHLETGLIYDSNTGRTAISPTQVEDEWRAFKDTYEEGDIDDEESDIEQFTTLLNKKYPGSDFARVYVEEIYCNTPDI